MLNSIRGMLQNLLEILKKSQEAVKKASKELPECLSRKIDLDKKTKNDFLIIKNKLAEAQKMVVMPGISEDKRTALRRQILEFIQDMNLLDLKSGLIQAAIKNLKKSISQSGDLSSIVPVAEFAKLVKRINEIMDQIVIAEKEVGKFNKADKERQEINRRARDLQKFVFENQKARGAYRKLLSTMKLPLSHGQTETRRPITLPGKPGVSKVGNPSSKGSVSKVGNPSSKATDVSKASDSKTKSAEFIEPRKSGNQVELVEGDEKTTEERVPGTDDALEATSSKVADLKTVSSKVADSKTASSKDEDLKTVSSKDEDLKTASSKDEDSEETLTEEEKDERPKKRSADAVETAPKRSRTGLSNKKQWVSLPRGESVFVNLSKWKTDPKGPPHLKIKSHGIEVLVVLQDDQMYLFTWDIRKIIRLHDYDEPMTGLLVGNLKLPKKYKSWVNGLPESLQPPIRVKRLTKRTYRLYSLLNLHKNIISKGFIVKGSVNEYPAQSIHKEFLKKMYTEINTSFI